MQNLDVHGNDITYLVPSEKKHELAVITRPHGFLPSPYSIQWISLGAEGAFQTGFRDTIWAKGYALRDLGIAIDPHRSILVGAGKRCVKIVHLYGSSGKPASKCNRRGLALPPKDKDDVNPEWFWPNLESKKNIRHWAHLVSGNRLLIESIVHRLNPPGHPEAYMYWMPKKWEYTVVDFRYRPDSLA
ncbi:hypothetical protein BDV06DRAFT_227764 [Aspergillus oleicola]